MVLSLENLEKFGLKPELINDTNRKIYDVLDQARKNYFESQNIENKKLVPKQKQKHEDSKKFIYDLLNLNHSEIKKFLLNQN